MSGDGIYPSIWNLGIDNRVINGDFLIDQRNEGAAITPAAAGFICDKWQQGQTQASKFTFQRLSTGLGNFKNSLQATVASTYSVGASDRHAIQHRIEGLNVADLGMGITPNCSKLVLSFTAVASITGTYAVAIQNSAANRTYIASYGLTAAVPQTIVLFIPPDITGTWLMTSGIGINILFDLGTGSTFAGTLNSWNAGDVTSNGTCVKLVGTAAATFQITNVRLYPGNGAVPYVPRPYAQELVLCQREYRKSFPAGTAPAQSAGVTGAVTVKNPIALGDPAEWIPFDPPMRVSPTIVTYNPSAANANWRDITAGSDATVSVDSPATKGPTGVMLATSGTVTTLGDYLAIHYTADAGL